MPKSPETRARMSEAQMGKRHTPETRAKMSASKKGKPGRRLSSYEKVLISLRKTACVVSEETRAKQRAAKLANPTRYWLGKVRGPHSYTTRIKMSESHTGVPKPDGFGEKLSAAILGHPAYHAKGHDRFIYRGLTFRSSYEVRLATALDALKIRWEYETHRFQLGPKQTWAPDFYLPDGDCFWEVKGWMGPRSKQTIAAFRHEHPDVRLIIVLIHHIEALEREVAQAA